MPRIQHLPSQTVRRRSTGVEAQADLPAAAQSAPTDGVATRAPYTPARLERLGPWRALTLQQSIPIGPGSGMLTPHMPNAERLA